MSLKQGNTFSESKWSESKDGKENMVDAGNGGEYSTSSSSLPGWAHIPFDEIELGECIGGGGVGMIYNGWWKNEPVALKTLFDTRIGEDLKKEYMDELLVMSRVKHSNIVTFLGACMTPPNLCFVMEMCEGSLFDMIHVKRETYSDRECVRMLIDVGSALEYLHAQKPTIIHRDIKSHNVLRAYDGSLKICDFGLVKVKNATAGTPAYMAPELIENKPFNKSVDTYAFGVMMWEMFVREIPFYMVSVSDIRERVCDGQRPRIPSYGIPPRCVNLINRCWAQRSEDRPDFTQIVDELLEILDEIPETQHTEVLGEGGDALDSLLRK